MGGLEIVFSRVVDYVKFGGYTLKNPEIEAGGMDYGFRIRGILGMDFLAEAGAVINLTKWTIHFG